MRSPLEARIAALRGRVRRLLALHGMSWVVGGVLLAIIAAGLADWLFPGHLVREVRLALLLGIIALGGWLFARRVVGPLVVRFQDLDIAHRIERRWPGLNDRLTSTVQFLQLARTPGDRDDVLGSQTLRDAVVRQTLAEVESIDFRAAVDPRPARRAMVAAGSALLLGLACVAVGPETSRIALARLLRPYGPVQWPKLTHLRITQIPARVARGDEFRLEVAVADGERIPGTARATYHFDDGHTETEALRPDDRGRFHGRRESVTRSFTVAIAAGDDAIGPRAVAVVPPPALTGVTVRLTPPAYTGLGTQTLAAGKLDFSAVIGTRVELEASVNKPLAVALLRQGEGITPPAVSIGRGGRYLSSKFTVAESTPFWFELKDTEGFRSQDADAARFELRAVRDEDPRVTIDEPPNDRDVTADATVPVAIDADDDFGLGLVRLLYRVTPAGSPGSEPTNEVIIPLWAAGTGAAPTKHRQVAHRWDLAPLKLEPGAVVSFHADARDLDTISPKGPKTGKSRELRLRVVTKDDILRGMDERLRELREDLQRGLTMQQQAQTPVQEARRALNQLDQPPKQTRDDLANAAVIQRQIGDRVTNKTDGLEPRVGRMLDDLKNLKIDSPEAQAQLQQIQQGLARVRDNHLGPAEQNLTTASKALDENAGDRAEQPEGDQPRDANAEKGDQDAQAKGQQAKGEQSKGQQSKGAQSKAQQGGDQQQGDQPEQAGDQPQGDQLQPVGQDQQGKPQSGKPQQGQPKSSNKPERRSDAAREALARADENQQRIADELARMLDGLKEFDTYRGVVQDAKKLLKDQEEAMKAAADAANKPDLAGKTPDALKPEQKLELENLGERQSKLADGLSKFENKMDEMAGRLDESDPLASAALRDAANQSREQGTASKAGKAAEGLQNNQMNDAQQAQKQVQQDLKDLIDQLQNRRENELSRLVKELKQSEKDLKALRDRQAKNREKTAQAQKNQNEQQRKEELQKLAKEQEDIQKELKKQLQKLRKLRADNAANAGSRAAGKMSKAQQEQEDDDAEAAAKEQEEALADLDEAEQDVRDARKDAEEQLAMEQLSKMADNLRGLLDQQEKLLGDTADYEARQAGGQALTRAQRASVLGLARAQVAIRDETSGLVERLDDAPVFALTLKRAVENMDRAADGLRDLKTGDDTQLAERNAARRFKQLLDALQPDPAENGGQQGQQQGGGQQGGGQRGGGDAITKAAQVKMLKALQQELNDRTEELDGIKARNKALTETQEQELARLEADQRNIADMARDLTRPKHDDGEED